MKVMAVTLAVLMGHGTMTPSHTQSLPDVVREIRAADYRGERAELQRLAAVLEGMKDQRLAEYRHYWRGFALWRRAINGFNETPTPPDLESDLRAGIVSFQAALASQPDWIEAHIGIFGCAGPLAYLAKDDALRREAVYKEYTAVVGPAMRAVTEKGADNARALWLMGQNQLGGGGLADRQPAKAAATFRRGIEAALAEARRAGADEPAWIPRWGGAENLMNLAYLYTHSALANRDLALAYAEGALVAAPEWHYVRDILWLKILDLPRPSSGEASPRN